MKKNKFFIIFIIILFIIFLFPSPIKKTPDTGIHCLCGGCCNGCPNDCDLLLGFPYKYLYVGRGITGIHFGFGIVGYTIPSELTKALYLGYSVIIIYVSIVLTKIISKKFLSKK